MTHVLYLNQEGVFKLRPINGSEEISIVNPCFLLPNNDFFFVNESIAAIQLRPKWVYYFFRVSNGSIIGVVNTNHIQLVWNHSETKGSRAPNATPTSFFDKSANKIYPITLATIIHLGSSTVRILPSDSI